MKTRLLLLAFSWMLASVAAFAQPANDNCNTAQSLGNLPTPNPCGGPPNTNPGVGATVTLNNLTNVGATGPQPYTTLLGCQGGGNQPGPAADVWYSFVATANEVFINISGNLPNPSVTLWSGTCGNLTGRGCANGNATSVAANFDQLVPGQTYFIQVSGGNLNQQGTFTMSVHNDNDCNDCLVSSNLTVNPPPTNGTYLPGTQVRFCYTITNWRQSNTNWLHGVVPTFGPGWNMATLGSFAAANSCDGQGQWSWFPGGATSTATGATFGPGFFYDRDGSAAPGVQLDGNPGNNFGDNCQGAVNWTFCWTITTAQCPPAANNSSLNVSINTLGDGESGSWANIACQQDPNYQFSAILRCCQPPLVTSANVPCANGTTGTATATGQGTGPYNYVWSNGQTLNNATGSSTINNLAPGTYTVTVTDLFDNCTTTQTVTITAPTPLAGSTVVTNVACFGQSTGAINLTPSGGSPNYTFNWGGGVTTEDRTNLPAGTYTVTITDQNGCTTTQTATITQPASAVAATAVPTNVSCFNGTNGSINLTPSGGTPNYTFNWGGGVTTEDRTNLGAGTYTVTVTDQNGCTTTQSVTITQPTQVVVNATSTPVACNGGTTGTVTATGSGGTGTITYQWSNGATGATVNNLPAGTYTVTATDANGCTRTTQVTVTQPTPVTVNATSTPVACNGGTTGTASASGTGGTGTITYQWSNGQTTQTATGLAAGTYTVTATDANGCTATTQVTVSQPTPVTVNATNTNVACSGGSNGTASATASGGSGTITYQWSNGATTQNISNLGVGTYTVTATDANGCFATATVTVSQAGTLTLNATNTNVSCNGGNNGTASASGLGGTGTLTYAWSNGASTQNISNLPAGTYTVTVTDQNGCSATSQVTVTQPTPVAVNATSTNVACNGAANGTASASGSGGTGTISYTWSNGGTGASISNLAPGTYTVTATDANGCTATTQVTVTQPTAVTVNATSTNVSCNGAANGTASASGLGGTGTLTYAWSNGASASTIGSLAPGTYTVTVTDQNGCTATTQVTVTQPTAVTVSATNTNVSCNGANNGTATASGLGGTGTISYAWSNGGTTATVNNLAPGTYTVTATDLNGCTATTQVTVTQPTPVTVSATNTNILCNGAATGTASATGLGGTGTISYTWSNGGTTQNISNLPAGTYTVTATDQNGCTATTQVTVTQPAAITLSASNTNVSCNGGNNGTATATGLGGAGTLTYAWSNGGSTATINNLPAGTYTVTVTDQNSCTATTQVTVTQPTQVTVSATSVNVNCNGANNGTASATGLGGTGTIGYAWSNGGNTASISNLAPGTYTVTATDLNGCTATTQVTITQPTPVTFTTSAVQALCGASNGSASVTNPSGGTGTYTYLWSNGQTTQTATNLAAGVYNVTVTDQNGCTATGQATVTSNSTMTSSITSPINVACNGGASGSATANGNGGSGTYTYLWSNGQTTQTATGLAAGTYTVTVTDANQCVSISQVTITQPTALSAATAFTPVICFGGTTGTASATPAGGTGTYSYGWSNGGNTQTISNISAGTYTVTVTDQNGCTTTQSVTVTQPTQVTVSAANTSVSCNAGSNGTATASGLGGTGTISYAWSNGGNTAAISNLPAGTYTVTATDQNGCTATATTTITQPTQVVAAATSTNSTCNGSNDGTATASGSGGTGAFTYAWSNGGSTATISNLAPGTFTVTVTDANGCTATNQVTITQPTVVTAQATSTPALCFGGSTGTATATGNGGTGNLSFAWSNGATGATANNLAAGNYTVTVTDQNGCTATQSVAVTQPTAVTLSSNVTANVDCFGGSNGSATVSAGGGLGGYTFTWSTPQGSGTSANNLPAGTYTVTVTDQNGCPATTSFTVTQPAPMTATGVTTAVNCYSQTPDGTAGVTVNGGTPPYSYFWSNGQTGPFITGLTQGSYTVTVTDANGCTATASMTVDPPTFPTVVAGPDVSFCEGSGGAQISAVAGNTGPTYYYQWWCNLPINICGIDSVNDNDPMVNPTQSAWYYVQVFDQNGCASDTDSVYVNVLPLPVVDAGEDKIICGDSAPCVVLTPTVSAAPGPYTYLWLPSTGLNDPTIPNPCARPDTTTIYALVVTSSNGCTSEFTTTDTVATVTVHVNPVPVADAGPDHEICYGDTVLLPGIGSNAGPDYTYEWSPSTGLSSNSTSVTQASPPSTTTYTLVVWSNGCPSYGDPVTVNVHTVPTIDAGWDREICYGDTVMIDAQAGGDSTATYTYTWTPSLPVVGGTDEDALVAPTQTTTFYVQGVSSHGCRTAVDSMTVYMIATPVAEAGPTQFYCGGDTVQLQGSYTFATAETANPSEVQALWTPSGGLSSTTDLQPFATPGVNTYYYLTTTYRTCSTTDSVLVAVGGAVNAVAQADTQVVCEGSSILLSSTGSQGVDYEWIPAIGVADPDAPQTSATPPSSMTYWLVMTSGACKDSMAVPVEVIPSPQASFLNSALNGCAPHQVSFTQNSVGGVLHSWHFGDGSPVNNSSSVLHTFDTPGSYPITLVAYGEGGCSDTAEVVVVNVGAQPVADFITNPEFPVEMSLPNTEVTFVDQSENAVTWLWDFGDGHSSSETNPQHQFTTAGSHFVTLTVTSEFGCVAQVVHGPFVVVASDLFIPNVFSPNGDGVNDKFLPEYVGSQPYLLQVFDRWGVMMYEGRNKTEGWDGLTTDDQPAPDGVYYYRVTVGPREYVGNVTLMR